MTAVRTAPGPRSYRPIGDLPAIQRDPLRVFMEARSQYGDAVRFRSGPFYMHFVVHPDGVNHILHDNWQNYGRGYSYRFLEPAVGQGLLTSEGELWLRQRRLAQPAFHRDRLAFFGSVMADA
ncbi:MAG: cytochrome P450, partial [Dehalococcoidia bacterium]|nr:cytochrome P450 [Dehalococcoidia bacterium]